MKITALKSRDNYVHVLRYIGDNFLEDWFDQRTVDNLLYNLSNYVELPLEQVVAEYEKHLYWKGFFGIREPLSNLEIMIREAYGKDEIPY